jgi:hypothetical protein
MPAKLKHALGVLARTFAHLERQKRKILLLKRLRKN